jgi:osmotically-inducible protein OsmY
LSPIRLGDFVRSNLITGASIRTTAAIASAQAPAADNTKATARDQEKGAVTADQQKDNAGDRLATQKIRRALMGDKALSTYAHNVKIVAQNGQVTQQGPVRSEAEKQAVAIVGAEHVVNALSVAPGRSKRTDKS